MRRWLRHLPGATGTAALLAAALLALWFAPHWQADAQRHTARAAQAAQQHQQRQQRAQTQHAAASSAARTPDTTLLQALPPGGDAPRRIAALVDLARQHGVRLDSVRQDAPLRLGSGSGQLAAERVPLRLAGSGPYGGWRSFVAQALQHDDALLLDQLRLARSSTASAELAAELQWSLLQRLAPLPAGTTPAWQLPTRAADWPAPAAAALLAWQGTAAAPAAAPAGRSAAAAPAQAPSRPAAAAFPYRWIGQLDADGSSQVLLASAQRSLGVRLGDTLDGRWRLQRAANGTLQALALADGDAVPVPGAPAAGSP